MGVFFVGSYFLAQSFFLYSVGSMNGGGALGALGLSMVPVGLIVASVSALSARRKRFLGEFVSPSEVAPGATRVR